MNVACLHHIYKNYVERCRKKISDFVKEDTEVGFRNK